MARWWTAGNPIRGQAEGLGRGGSGVLPKGTPPSLGKGGRFCGELAEPPGLHDMCRCVMWYSKLDQAPSTTTLHQAHAGV